MAGEAVTGRFQCPQSLDPLPGAVPVGHAQADARVRLIVRHTSELLLKRDVRWQQIAPQQPASFIIELLLSAGLAHLPYRRPDGGAWIGVDDAFVLARPVSGMQLATSMNMSYATVRRRLVDLMAAGRIERSDAGYRVAASQVTGDLLREVAKADALDLMQLVTVLAAAGYAPAVAAAEAGIERLPSWVVERQLLAFSLRLLETFAARFGDGPSGTMMMTIIAANVRHITQDPELAAHYAAEDTPPPDELRRPITLRELSRALDLPFETVRRRAARLVAYGVDWKVADGRAGLIVPTRILMGPAYLANNRHTVVNFGRMLTTLADLQRSVG
jgi:DNA-binding Lrp family transcriptional regulator